MVARIFLTLLVACGAHSCFFPEDECDGNPAEWCEDNEVHACEGDSGNSGIEVMRDETLEDCDDSGTTCIEAKVDGRENAYCGLTDHSCPGFETYMCLGEIVAFCAEGMEYPEYVDDCSSEERYCQETWSGDRPQCSLIDEACGSEDDEACFDLYPHGTFLCDDGAWLGSGYACIFANRVCCEREDGEIECVSPDSTSNCTNF